jgi:hypothetical protein
MIDQTAEALTDLGNMAIQQRNDALARRLYEEGLAIWWALDYKPGIVHLHERLERLTANRTEPRPRVASSSGELLAPSSQQEREQVTWPSG